MPDIDQNQSPKGRTLRVRGGTSCHDLASAITGSIERQELPLMIEYIGAGAGNQAVKAVAISNSLLHRQGVFISVIPSFFRRALKDNDQVVVMQLGVKIHQL